MTYDVAMLGNATTGLSPLRFDNKACTGAYKLLQRTIVLLLTDRNDPNSIGGIGTEVPSLLRGANMTSLEELNAHFNIAVTQIKGTLISDITPSTPADEIPDNIVAAALQTGRDSVHVEITVTTQAGSAVTIQLPIDSITE